VRLSVCPKTLLCAALSAGVRPCPLAPATAELQNMRRKGQDDERQREEAQRSLGAIEAAARKAYNEDIAAAVRPEDQLGPALPGA
jgi:hypothetical protein